MARACYGRVQDIDIDVLLMILIAQQKTDIESNLSDDIDMLQDLEKIKALVQEEKDNDINVDSNDCLNNTLNDERKHNS